MRAVVKACATPAGESLVSGVQEAPAPELAIFYQVLELEAGLERYFNLL